ncbi:MAG: aryl-sulfate sulfotransferase [Saprospiraceae bacterium]|nr:aryl-sulfate sulfotransferase [Saprospiraceae bacterium]
MRNVLLSLLCTLGLAAALGAQTQTVGLFLNDSLSVNGYTLFSNSKVTYLIDNCGFVVKRWDSDYPTLSAVYLLENGNLLRAGRVPGSFGNSGGIGGQLELFSWEGALLWSYRFANDTMQQHHDIRPMPNGHILVQAWEIKSPAATLAAGRRPDALGATGLWPEWVAELEMVGTDQANIVWEWHLWDHLVQDIDAGKANFGVVAEHPERIHLNYFDSGSGPNAATDWVHSNAIAYNPELDQIALCSRVFSEIWIIDHSTTTEEAKGHSGGKYGKGGDILYRWGNPQTYGRGSSFDRSLFGQHDVRWAPEGYPFAGQLMVFNNGTNRPNGSFSSVDIWTPPTDSAGFYRLEAGLPYGPALTDWSYSVPGFYSSNISGAHLLPNGNVFICEGQSGHFFEITPDKTSVWDYINPVSTLGPVPQGVAPGNNATFRATRYPATYPAFAGKTLSPGAPVEQNPWPSDCVLYGETVSTTAGDQPQRGIRLRSNPVREELVLENPTRSRCQVEVFSATGQQLAEHSSAEELIRLDARAWPAAPFFVRVIQPGTGRATVLKAIKH